MEANGQPDWGSPSTCPPLGDDDVHVWRAFLPQEQSRLDHFEVILSPDERARSAKFRRAEDRAAFILSRGILRHLLSLYTETPPERIQFDYTEFGKPLLYSESGASALSFNVSHSGEWSLFAVARNHEIGIDVEHIRTNLDAPQIARRFFSLREAKYIREAVGEAQTKRFYEIWVCKEAYVKAVGNGLSMSMKEFTVPLGLHEPIAHQPEGAPWQFHGVTIAPDYVAALATPSPFTHIHKFHWLFSPQSSCMARKHGMVLSAWRTHQ